MQEAEGNCTCFQWRSEFHPKAGSTVSSLTIGIGKEAVAVDFCKAAVHLWKRHTGCPLLQLHSTAMSPCCSQWEQYFVQGDCVVKSPKPWWTGCTGKLE